MFAEFNIIQKNSIFFGYDTKQKLDIKRIIDVNAGYLNKSSVPYEHYYFVNNSQIGTRVIKFLYHNFNNIDDLYFVEYSDELLKKIEDNYYFSTAHINP